VIRVAIQFADDYVQDKVSFESILNTHSLTAAVTWTDFARRDTRRRISWCVPRTTSTWSIRAGMLDRNGPGSGSMRMHRIVLMQFDWCACPGPGTRSSSRRAVASDRCSEILESHFGLSASNPQSPPINAGT
jgi:hypothetical protein